MSELPAGLVPALGRALLHFLWQGALIGVVAALCLQGLRDARPQARYAVACLALLACVLAPVATLLAPLVAPSFAPLFAFASNPRAGGGVASNAAGAFALSTNAAPAWLDAWLPTLVMLWAAGTLALSLRTAMGLAWVRCLGNAPQPAAQPAWQARLDALAVHFALPRRVVLRVVDGLESPVAAGWWRPMVLLPAALLARMPVDLIEALLAHELAHVRRHDYLVNLLQHAVEALLFYHPVTWWLSRRIRIEREQVADQLAAEVACAPRRLALALSALSDLQRDLPELHFAPAAHGGQLMSRIRHLVRPDRPAPAGARLVFPLLGVAAACLATLAWAHVAAPKHDDVSIRVLHDDAGAGGDSFALVSERGADVSILANHQARDGFEAARRAAQGDFLWVRRDGKDYVVTDPAVLARARAAWADAETTSRQMDALGAQMEVHGKRLEAIGARMETESANHDPSADMQAAQRAMEALGRKQADLAQLEQELAMHQEHARDAAEQDRLARKMDALALQQDALAQQQDAYSQRLDAESARLDALAGPMESLSAEMELASAPMQELGRRMEALGKVHEQAAHRAERDTRQLIDEAVAKGLARPVAKP